MSKEKSSIEQRTEYAGGELRRSNLVADPLQQFTKWFDEVCESGQREPNAMSLATASTDLRPSLRTVLLKHIEPNGFVFYTNHESTKARQMAENPHVALLFYWQALERQVCVTGTAERLSHKESLRYFVTRPVGSRLGAWASLQSSVISSRKFLEMKYEEMKRKFSEGDIPLPSTWGGYRVIPQTVEFWQGRRNRLHDRFLYTREADCTWRIDRLAP